MDSSFYFSIRSSLLHIFLVAIFPLQKKKKAKRLSYILLSRVCFCFLLLNSLSVVFWFFLWVSSLCSYFIVLFILIWKKRGRKKTQKNRLSIDFERLLISSGVVIEFVVCVDYSFHFALHRSVLLQQKYKGVRERRLLHPRHYTFIPRRSNIWKKQ